MNTQDFVIGKYNTHFIEDNKEFLADMMKCEGDCKAIAIIAAFIEYDEQLKKVQPVTGDNKTISNWKTCGRRKSIARF